MLAFSIVTTTVATTTTTITVVQPPGGAGLTARGELVARATTVTPTAIPTYLSGPCRLPNAYRGACSCMGIRPTTTTAPTPTSTTSITHTVTETVTAECAPIAEECSDISTTPCPNSPLGCFCGRRSDGGESCVQPGGSLPTKGALRAIVAVVEAASVSAPDLMGAAREALTTFI
ncbi:uncharacterized protein BDV14DRAFT_204019 [Aspergillus stella-maris]|uniref:uncharacterized protein n=1 Tax=Aspergillus stella-maris TaxID=1810926 RepID=UPI003CCCF470